MKTAIIYYSKHGTTKKVAHLIGNKLDFEPDYISLKECCNPDIRFYDRIVLGTSIYAGNPGKSMSRFCTKNYALLTQKIVGLFVCCMDEENEIEQLKKAYPECLQTMTIPIVILGGEFIFEKMNFIERFVTMKITKVKTSISKLRYVAIEEFTQQINTSKRDLNT